MTTGRQTNATAIVERLRSRMKRATKQILGRMLVKPRPDIARRIEAGRVDAHLSHFRDKSLVERLILEAIIARRQAEGATSGLVQWHAEYWASDRALAFRGRGFARGGSGHA